MWMWKQRVKFQDCFKEAVKKVDEHTITSYLEELGAKKGKPGGGSAAGLVGAMSASLGRMVADIQYSKKKFASKKEVLDRVLEETTALSMQLKNLSAMDAKVFEWVSTAYALPKKTAEEQRVRQEKINKALEKAAQPPLETMSRLPDVFTCFERLSKIEIKGSIVNDIAVGVLFAKAALEASYLNVLINTREMKSKKKKAVLEKSAENYFIKGTEQAETLYQQATEKLR